MSGPRYYVETSALLRFLLEGDAHVAAMLLVARGRLMTSSLTGVEAARALLRAVGDGRIDSHQQQAALQWLHTFMRSCLVVALEGMVLARASSPFPAEPVRALDALHLASALLWQEHIGSTVVLSCDRRVRNNAHALGMTVLPESI